MRPSYLKKFRRLTTICGLVFLGGVSLFAPLLVMAEERLSPIPTIAGLTRLPPANSPRWGENRLTPPPTEGMEGEVFAKMGIAPPGPQLSPQRQPVFTASLPLELRQALSQTETNQRLASRLELGSKVITLSSLLDPFWEAGLLPAGVEAGGNGSASSSAPATFREILKIDSNNPIQSASAGLLISLTADTGTGANFVYNGEQITYTIRVTNMAASALNNVSIADEFPLDTLVQVNCFEPCNLVTDTEAISSPFGSTINIVRTLGLTWPEFSLGAGEVITRRFSARVTCRAEGEIFDNSAFVLAQGQVNGTAIASTEARNRLEIAGKASLSTSPTWCSNDSVSQPGGTLSQDWGDFDRDGDLDLALGSTLGTVVYRNDNGKLTEFWKESRFTLGVAWADFDNALDHYLELVAVGESANNNSPLGIGTNYIYKYQAGAETFTELDTFASDLQLLRVAPGDYNGDGLVDLVVSKNALGVGCAIFYYQHQPSGNPPFLDNETSCLSNFVTASLSQGDYDNDNDLDLAIGLFGYFGTNVVVVLVNNTFNPLCPGALPLGFCGYIIDFSLSFIPYDLAWGDYDNDGFLDLAAAFPFQREARLYHNNTAGFFDPNPKIINTQQFFTPLAIDWGDFNGDGNLDLAVVDSPPKIYDPDNNATPVILALSNNALPDQLRVWSLRGLDLNNDADLELAMSNQFGPSLLFSMFAPMLSPTHQLIPAPFRASDISWADVVSDTSGSTPDGFLDILLGANIELFNQTAKNTIYVYGSGVFTATNAQFPGLGPHAVAFGDENGDRLLDVALANQNNIRVFRNPNWSGLPVLNYTSASNNSLAWADADNNNEYCLDLLVGRTGSNLLFVNQKSGSACALGSSPAWTSTEADDTRSVAWGDYDNDDYLDFAVGNANQPNRIYHNNKNNTFSLAHTFQKSDDTRSVAWGDWDNDGDLDLAVGNYGGADFIYENLGGIFNDTRLITLVNSEGTNTTSLAWGDWDNDGDIDLAMGNDGQPDRVYANLGAAGSSQLVWLWQSTGAYATTRLAWGDKDGDGDLDLAFSENGGGQSGIYENNYALPGHLTPQRDRPLPDNLPYLSLSRPGQTPAAYFFSSAEMMTTPAVTINYTLFDPEGPPQDDLAEAGTRFEFRLDQTGAWQTASPTASLVVPTPTQSGQPAIFVWDALKDKAVSDNVQFRITIVRQNNYGRTQRASMRAVSPPFRVRALNSCVWPDNPVILIIDPPPFDPEKPLHFVGTVSEGDGLLTFSWEFGDGMKGTGQSIFHTYPVDNTYVVTLTVSGEPCPVANQVVTTRLVPIGSGIPPRLLYLPVIFKKNSNSPSPALAATQAKGLPGPDAPPGAPTPVEGLHGQVDASAGSTRLSWELNQAGQGIRNYNIYRAPRDAPQDFRLLATVSAESASYTDVTAGCGMMYLLTVLNDQGESLPGETSYFSPRC